MGRLLQHFEGIATRERHAGVRHTPDIKLTPAMSLELRAELGYDADELITCQGVHKVRRIYCNIRATGDNVILCPRDDLFSESDAELGIHISNANSVTSIPDNIGCCEVVSAGPLATCVKPGDVAFISFILVKQGYILENEECYIADSDAFCGLYDMSEQRIKPLANYVVTKQVAERMAVALNGTDRVKVLPHIITTGFVSGKTSSGGTAAHTLYQEVVEVGPLTKRRRPDLMTPREKRVLDLVCRNLHSGYDWAEYDGVDQAEADIINALREERRQGREPDIAAGDLVGFCEEIGQKIRIKGERHYLVPYDNVLAAIDDGAILERAIRDNRAGSLIRSA